MALAEAPGPALDDPVLLRRLFLREAHQVVVEVHGLHRLDEERRAGRRRGVDDPLHRARRVGPYGDHVPPVPLRDEVVANHRLGAGLVQVRFEQPAKPLADARRGGANAPQVGAGGVGDPAVGIHVAHDVVRVAAKIGERAPELAEPGVRARREAQQRGPELPRRDQSDREVAQSRRGDPEPLHRDPLQRGRRIGQPSLHQPPVLGEVTGGLRHGRMLPLEAVGVGAGRKREDPGPPGRRRRVRRDGLEHGVELERLPRFRVEVERPGQGGSNVNGRL